MASSPALEPELQKHQPTSCKPLCTEALDILTHGSLTDEAAELKFWETHGMRVNPVYEPSGPNSGWLQNVARVVKVIEVLSSIPFFIIAACAIGAVVGVFWVFFTAARLVPAAFRLCGRPWSSAVIKSRNRLSSACIVLRSLPDGLHKALKYINRRHNCDCDCLCDFLCDDEKCGAPEECQHCCEDCRNNAGREGPLAKVVRALAWAGLVGIVTKIEQYDFWHRLVSKLCERDEVDFLHGREVPMSVQTMLVWYLRFMFMVVSLGAIECLIFTARTPGVMDQLLAGREVKLILSSHTWSAETGLVHEGTWTENPWPGNAWMGVPGSTPKGKEAFRVIESERERALELRHDHDAEKHHESVAAVQETSQKGDMPARASTLPDEVDEVAEEHDDEGVKDCSNLEQISPDPAYTEESGSWVLVSAHAPDTSKAS